MSKAKSIGQVIFGFGLLFATALAFQNCSGYQLYDIPTETDLSSTCGTACNNSLAGLNLKLTNQALSIQEANLPAGNRVLDVGGYCDDAELPTNEIQYRWYEGSTQLSSDWVRTGVACNDIGRFQIAAVVPAVNVSKILHLEVRVAIPKGNGVFESTSVATRSLPVEIYK